MSKVIVPAEFFQNIDTDNQAAGEHWFRQKNCQTQSSEYVGEILSKDEKRDFHSKPGSCGVRDGGLHWHSGLIYA